jgi:hypothetical protein
VLTAARAGALFASHLFATGQPPAAHVRAAIAQAVRMHGGTRGCAAQVAAEYGDYRETAAPRMRWARATVEQIFSRPTGDHRARATRVTPLHL